MTTINGIEAHLLAQRVPEDHAKREKFSEGEGTAEEGIENLRRLFPRVQYASASEHFAAMDQAGIASQEKSAIAGSKFGKNAHVSVS